MKIRIVSRPIAPPWDSGSMNMAYGLGVCLAEQQHSVYLPAVQGFNPSNENVVVEPVYTNRRFSLDQKARIIIHLLKAQRADIMHFFLGVTRATAVTLALIAKIRRTPSVLTITHIPRPGHQPVVFGQRIVTYSAYFARLLKESGVEQVVHIPPGVDERVIHPGIDGSKAGRQLGILPDVPVVLYGGEFGHSATLATLLEAISICSANRPQVRYVLACRINSKYEQARKHKLVQQLQNAQWGRNVIVQEQVPHMRTLIARADVCILPLRDTFGKVDIPLFLLEAMAMAKPIVITDIAPLNEILDEPAGLSVPVDDAAALAQAIEQMLTDGESYGARGRQIVERRYRLRQIAHRYDEIYAELLSETHARLLR